LPSCQRTLASRIGLSADVFQTLDSGFHWKLLLRFQHFRHPWRSRRNDDVIGQSGFIGIELHQAVVGKSCFRRSAARATFRIHASK